MAPSTPPNAFLASSLPSTPSSSRSVNQMAEAFQDQSLQSPQTRDVFQTIVKGRKSWKTLRGGEKVWPLELEAALLEGLEKYQPDDSRETRLLGRFPMRNRFISDYILHKTGKRRTAKQVGSRLQQLRDTCGGKRLLNLLSPCRRQFGPGSSRTYAFLKETYQNGGAPPQGLPPLQFDADGMSDKSSIGSPRTPTDQDAKLAFLPEDENMAPAPRETVIYIDLIPETDAALQSEPSSPVSSHSSTSPTSTHGSSNFGENNIVRASQQPRYLRAIDPTITFLAHTATSACSNFTVYCDGSVVHTETTNLTLLGPPPEGPEGSLLYRTTLVPGFWDTLAETADATRFTIVQQVIQDVSESSSSTMFSATYKFNYAMGSMSVPSTPSPTFAFQSTVDPTFVASVPNMDFSLDCIDSTTFGMGCDGPETYYGFNVGDLGIRPEWNLSTQIPTGNYNGCTPQLMGASEAGDENCLLSPNGLSTYFM